MNKEKNYQMCTRCVMDTTDTAITFDENGVCNHCRKFDTVLKPKWFPNKKGKAKLDKLIKQVKIEGKGNEYDCVIGLSGGVDSSYLAYILRTEYPELRILAIHVDGGWNSELAVQNIQNIVEILNIDLHTEVIDWEEMRDLQLAYLKSSLANQDVPQDHAFFATLYKQIRKHGIKYFLTGHNIATESILPSSWGYKAMDGTQLRAIHKLFGKKKLKKYTILSFFDAFFRNKYFNSFQTLSPLDYWSYNKEEAKKIITDKIDWRDYGGKHHESRFTKFFQSHYLIEKFGYDKRKAHLSSLVVSGQMTRDEALLELEKPLYIKNELQDDKEFIAKKLGLTLYEFNEILALPNKNFTDYPSEQRILKRLNKIKKYLKVLKK